jgi:hypothetical protein
MYLKGEFLSEKRYDLKIKSVSNGTKLGEASLDLSLFCK